MLSSGTMKKRPPTPGAVVGAAVRQLRKDRGWTLEDLSRQTDISVSGLSQLESGKTSRVRSENVTRLAAALGVPESELDPRRCGDRVAAEATTLEHRRLVDTVLSLPAGDAAEATRLLKRLAARRKEDPDR